MLSNIDDGLLERLALRLVDPASEMFYTIVTDSVNRHGIYGALQNSNRIVMAYARSSGASAARMYLSTGTIPALDFAVAARRHGASACARIKFLKISLKPKKTG